jgi:hypothetical protein
MRPDAKSLSKINLGIDGRGFQMLPTIERYGRTRKPGPAHGATWGAWSDRAQGNVSIRPLPDDLNFFHLFPADTQDLLLGMAWHYRNSTNCLTIGFAITPRSVSGVRSTPKPNSADPCEAASCRRFSRSIPNFTRPCRKRQVVPANAF